MSRRACLILLGFVSAAFTTGAAIIPTVRSHVDGGGSPWTYAWLLVPFIMATTGVFTAAGVEPADPKPAAPEWGLYGHDAEERMFQTERNLARADYGHAAEVGTALTQPWTSNVLGHHPKEGDR